MTYDSYYLMFVISGITGVVSLGISITLFFKLKIPKVIGDITGSNAKKAISELRQKNLESGEKTYKPSPINLERGKLTDKITSSGKLNPISKNTPYFVDLKTEDITNKSEYISDETEVLSDLNKPTYYSGETTVLEATQATVVNNSFNVEVDITFTQSNESI